MGEQDRLEQSDDTISIISLRNRRVLIDEVYKLEIRIKAPLAEPKAAWLSAMRVERIIGIF